MSQIFLHSFSRTQDLWPFFYFCIFEVLIKNSLDSIKIDYEPEPIFEHIKPNQWYLDFASNHEDIKIMIHDFYNPDYVLSNGTRLEVTLSENTAYKKVFRYGHQTPALKIVWLDKDSGLHEKVCKNIKFPNVQVVNAQGGFSELKMIPGGNELLDQFIELKNLKHIRGGWGSSPIDLSK